MFFSATTARAQETVVEDFEGKEVMAGATKDPAAAKSGKSSGRIDAQLAKVTSSPWVTASKSLEYPNAITKLSFWVKSSEADRLTVRITDKSGQTHQLRPPIKKDGNWQEVVITTFEQGEGHQNFGGASDGKVHWPAKSLGIMVEKGYLGATGNGTVWLDDVRVTLDPERLVGELDLLQDKPGNIFTTEEPVRIPVDTQADEVAWKATDFWGTVLGEGVVPAKDKRAVIEPGLKRLGYFELAIEARKGGHKLADTTTSFAVIVPAADLRKTPDSPFGVMTHFAQGWDTDIMPLIAKAGIGVIRDELYWNEVEKTRGEYTFTRFDPYMAKAKDLGLQPLISMVFGNELYDHRDGPSTPSGYAGYGNYGQAILKHYGTQIRWLEIWNEYNGSWSPPQAKNDRPKYYTEMLKVAYAKIKAVRPDVKVLGGAAVLLPLPWFDGIFKNGGLNAMDALVIHPYRWSPEGVDREIDDLRALAARYGKKDMPVWVTETGRHDDTPEGRTIVARYLAKMYTILLQEKCEKICWYLMRDYNEFKSMGLLRDYNSPFGRYAPAPAYPVYANLIQQLQGATPQGREQTADALQVYRFDKGGSQVRVAWALTPSEINFEATGPVRVIDMMGVEQTLQPVAGRVRLTLDEEPVYLIGNVKPAAGGPITFAAAQIIDYDGPFDFRYSLEGDAKAEITFAGQAPVTLIPGRNQSVILPGFDSGKPGSVRARYTLSVGGQPASTGVVLFRVEEPLAVSPPFGVKADAMLVTLQNNGRGELKITGLRSGAGEATEAITLAPGTAQNVSVPARGLRNYKKNPTTLEVNFAGRPTFRTETAISNNPIPRKTIGLTPALADWADVPPIPVKVIGEDPKWETKWAKVAWDDKFLYLAMLGNAPFLSAEIAGANDPLSSWKEIDVDANASRLTLSSVKAANATVPGASVAKAQTNEGTLTQATIPWAAISPEGRSAIFRLGLQAGSDANLGGAVGLLGEPQFLSAKNPVSLPVWYLEGAPDAALPAPAATAAAPTGQARLLTDQLRDFSAEQGRNGWSYGYFDGKGGGKGDARWPMGAYSDDDFKPLTYAETMWGYEWSNPDIFYLKLSSLGGHPGSVQGKPAWAVRRWTSNYEGPAKISGAFDRLDKSGDGTGFVILVDGVEVLHRDLRGAKESFSCPVVLKKGSLVDFAITPGPGSDTSFDACGFQSSIEAVETPKNP